jgi:hypothetical protein
MTTTEKLFPVHAHALFDAGEDRGLHVEAFVIVRRAGFVRSAASDHSRAFGLTYVDVRDDAVVLDLRDLRALVSRIVPLVFDFAHSLERRDKLRGQSSSQSRQGTLQFSQSIKAES